MNAIMNKINGTVSKIGFALKKRSPEILVVAGVIGTVTSAVLACRATTKIGDILDDRADQLQTVEDELEVMNESEDLEEVNYTEEDAVKDRAIINIQTGVKLAKLYSPAVALGVVSLGCIIASHNILKKRNVAIAAAYAAIDKSFKEYRGRVVKRFGDEVDKQLKYNYKSEEVEEKIVDEKGKEKTVKKTVDILDGDLDAASPYVKYFTKSNPYWENDSSYNEMFIRTQQNFLNDELRAKGHITLNHAYEALGMNPTKAGMVVGWLYDVKNPTGDNFIEFDVKKVHVKDEDDSFEEVYAIDFNVDGNIYNQMV